ncbi:hypothetical protein [Oryza sativa Japonica Group]|uniref:Uncharacterized protein n=1 Tax=Oryza sativa subsp. japonica TaxID=39947 RepID=Q5JK95_ORYSJ|nr:hypothetical protein [Oryza sativa Japonica Group]BAD88112.1 hypothetical protein [Oryza sativa Japonica Group]
MRPRVLHQHLEVFPPISASPSPPLPRAFPSPPSSLAVVSRSSLHPPPPSPTPPPHLWGERRRCLSFSLSRSLLSLFLQHPPRRLVTDAATDIDAADPDSASRRCRPRLRRGRHRRRRRHPHAAAPASSSPRRHATPLPPLPPRHCRT